MTTTTFDWTHVAAGWDTHRDHVEAAKAPVTRELLAQLDLRPGERVLELGAGTGDLAVKLAELVGPAGSVVATDVAPGMVALVRRTTAGLANVEVAQLDALDITLPAESVDAVVFRMGLMFADRPEVALRECLRVLAPAGRLGLAVWAGPEHNPWMTCVGMSAMMHGLVSGGPPTGPGGVFSLGDPAALERVVRTAGFEELTLREVDVTITFADADAHFEHVSALAGPLALVIAAADEDQRAAVRRTAADAVERFQTADGIALPGRALVCTARKGETPAS